MPVARSRAWLVVALGAGLLVAGTASTSPPSSSAGDAQRGNVVPPKPPGSSPPSLIAAQALFFGNRYDEADRTYRVIIDAAPDDAAAQAAYALFLNYEHAFAAALSHAKQAVAQPNAPARAYAVLARVDDWSNHLGDALTAGRRAVELGPDDILGHLFLSEALADHGDIAPAQQEIDAAKALVTDSTSAYERAEVRREQGNLAHDKGDLAAAVTAYQGAYDTQPTWVERPSELAAALLEYGNLPGARAALDKARALAPQDAGLLASLGEVSLLQPDYAGAEKAYTSLLALRPRDPAILDLNAQVAMAAHHDTARVRSLLQAALSIDPGDVEAATYLVYLDRNVVGDDALAQTDLRDAVAAGVDDAAPAGRRRAVPNPDAALRGHALTALEEVNRVRAAAGLTAVALDDRLSQSAASHAYYWLFNNASATVANLGIHREVLGLPGFIGVLPLDRDRAYGYVRSGSVGEDITHRGEPRAAVDDWVNSVFHRFPILRPDLAAIGYGDASIGPIAMEDMEFAFIEPDGPHHVPVLYPASRQQSVPTTFVDNELPDPVPPGAPRSTGYPVTVNFDTFARVTMDRFSVAGPDGVELPGYLGAPTPASEKTAWILPQAPFRAHTTYTAHYVGTVDGSPFDRTWTFTTGA